MAEPIRAAAARKWEFYDPVNGTRRADDCSSDWMSLRSSPARGHSPRVELTNLKNEKKKQNKKCVRCLKKPPPTYNPD